MYIHRKEERYSIFNCVHFKLENFVFHSLSIKIVAMVDKWLLKRSRHVKKKRKKFETTIIILINLKGISIMSVKFIVLVLCCINKLILSMFVILFVIL